jgi:K+:H+ antiporter
MVLILVGKSLVALGIVLLLGYPLSTALTVSASLVQIGEFSFILSGLGIRYGLMPPEGLNLILAGALLSITLNPLVFAGAERMIRRVRNTPKLNSRFEESRSIRFARLKEDLEGARRRQAAKAAASKTFTPEELIDGFPLFSGLTPEQREVLALHFGSRTAEPG